MGLYVDNQKTPSMDFLLGREEVMDGGFRQLIFRFYPEKSHCHSFGDDPPRDENDIYKLYYSFAVIKQSKWEEGSELESEVMFREDYDENSVISDVAYVCEKLSKGIYSETWVDKHNIERIWEYLDEGIKPFGSGTEWKIHMHEFTEQLDEEGEWMEEEQWYQKRRFRFELWNYVGTGFRFWMEEKDLLPFSEFLSGCHKYMIGHGEGI